jgi:tetratricopeptide (TPR) repeat protein
MNVIRFAWVILILFAPLAQAVKMDESTHDEVIKRLEMGIESMEKSDSELPGIQVRLADLYADRARLKAMNEMTGNCSDCKASAGDRARAITLYNSALPRIGKDQQGKVVLQIAHLQNLNDQSGKSIALYKKVIRNPKGYSSPVKGLAYAAVGEIYFKKGDFKTAKRHFELARKEQISNRAFIEYRLAWTQLNLGQFDQAVKTLTNLLQNPQILATMTTEGKAIDPTFVQDVSADLARFLARSEIGPQQVELLKQLSPESSRKMNLKTLATEADRLGKKRAAVAVWAVYAEEGQVDPEEKLEIQARLAQIHYDLHNEREAVQAYEKALSLWKSNSCSHQEMCTELKGRLRRFVTSWHKSEGKKPTMGLFRAYAAYIQMFPETQMVHWSAQVGSAMGQHESAISLFHQAAVQASAELKKNPSSKEMNNIFEGSLLGEIEAAEAMKSAKAQETAYNFYLSINPQGPQAFAVRYQRAQLFVKQNRHQDAFNEFHYLATAAPGPQDLKTKSADLALDSLVALKDDAGLQVRGLEYARIFSQRKAEYLKISRTATMNIVANNLKSERSDFKASLVVLNGVNLEGADQNERLKFYKNKILVAQKALDLEAVDNTADKMLGLKLANSDREWAMAQKVWVSELQLNFGQAYRLTKHMGLPHLSKSDRELRLALLADLAGLDVRKHNEAFLRSTNNIRAANLVRVTLIKNSSAPWRELEKQKRHLALTPDLLAGITLETFARVNDFGKAQRMLNTTRIGRFSAGQTLARHIEMKAFKSFNRKISGHQLYGYNDRVMGQTIRERLRLIGQSERLAQTALRNHDWTMQILTLSQLARENRRLYNNILDLPIPRKLDTQQKVQYQKLLEGQSQPYLARAEKIESELSQMWHSSNSVQNLQNAFMTASNELQKLYRAEVTELAAIAPSGAQNRLQNLLNTPYKRPSQRDILLARRELRENPFDLSKAKTLRELEAQNGRPAMVVYLDERISQLKTGKSL